MWYPILGYLSAITLTTLYLLIPGWTILLYNVCSIFGFSFKVGRTTGTIHNHNGKTCLFGDGPPRLHSLLPRLKFVLVLHHLDLYLPQLRPPVLGDAQVQLIFLVIERHAVNVLLVVIVVGLGDPLFTFGGAVVKEVPLGGGGDRLRLHFFGFDCLPLGWDEAGRQL